MVGAIGFIAGDDVSLARTGTGRDLLREFFRSDDCAIFGSSAFPGFTTAKIPPQSIHVRHFSRDTGFL
jgi:hypothetical protein